MSFKIMEAVLCTAWKWVNLSVEMNTSSQTGTAWHLCQVGEDPEQDGVVCWAVTLGRIWEVTWSCSFAEAAKGQGFWCLHLILLLLTTQATSAADLSL